jgi:hypothetical protein
MLLFHEQLGRDDYVSIDNPEWNPELLRHQLSPATRFAHRIFIANNQSRANFIAELQEMVIRIAPQYETNAALVQSLCDGWDALLEKSIMTQVRVRVIGNGSKEDYTRYFQRVCSADSGFKCRIVERALSALHPVNHAISLRIRIALAKHRDARVR